MQMIKDTRGFSSSIDVLLFLVLVSVSAVLLAPAMVGNTQLMALHDTSAAEHNSQVLLSLQNGRVDDFSYAVAGAQMDYLVNGTFGPDAVDSGIYLTGKKLVAGREINHKTFADLASESVASQFTIYRDDRSVRLNLLTDEYRSNLDTQMQDYLDMQIGDRYNYNVSVVWRPFRDVPIGGETHMGRPVPDTAYVESSWITMTYHTEYTRYYVENLIDSELDAIGLDLANASVVPREETEELIAGHINDAINRTVDDAVGAIVKMTIEQTIERAQTAINQQVDNVVPGNNSGISDIIIDEVLAELKNDPTFIEDASLGLSEQITEYTQEVAREEVHAVIAGEVDALASDITDQYVSNAATVEEAKVEVLDYVFSRIDISRARMTLALWDGNS
jgi:type II secretory pathway pseudopilin PulG